MVARRGKKTASARGTLRPSAQLSAAAGVRVRGVVRRKRAAEAGAFRVGGAGQGMPSNGRRGGVLVYSRLPKAIP